MREVLTKADFYRRFLEGEFGNRHPAWDSAERALAQSSAQEFILRSRVPGGPFLTGVRREDLLAKFDPALHVCSLEAPDHRRTFQGECIWAPDYDLQVYGAVGRGQGLRMREDLAQYGQYWSGVKAQLLLRHFMWPSDYDDLVEMSLTYLHHVFEFTCFDCAVGDCSHRNTIFWEVRSY